MLETLKKMLDILTEGSIPDFMFTFILTIFLALIQQWFLFELLTPKKPGSFWRPFTFVMALVYDIILQTGAFLQDLEFYQLIHHLIPVIPLLIYSCCFLKGSVLQKILMILITNVISYIVSDFFVAFWLLLGFSMTEMHESDLIFVSTTIVVHILTFTLNALFVKFYKKAKVMLNRLETFQIALISALTFVFILISINTTTLVNDTRISMFIAITTVCLICMTLVTYFMIFKISRNHQIEQENELLRMEKEYRQQQYESIKQQSEQITKIRHDYKNNFLVISSLIVDGNDEKAVELINKNIDKINEAKSHIKTNNDVVNAIVNAKMTAAMSMGIKVNFVSISDFDGIDDFDLCNLISNLFDNAITAVSDCDDKIIDVTISQRNGCYVFKMQNTISKSVIEENPTLATTKNDKSRHGYGMKIMQDIADRYNGELDYYEKEETFCVLVHLAVKTIVNA